MKSHPIVAMLCGLGVCSLQTLFAAHAQDRSAADGPAKIKALLIRPGGWKAYYNLPGGYDKGEAEIAFEAHGERVVAKIRNFTHPGDCERDVTITSDAVRLDGCNDRGITLHFDPKDSNYPLKGKSVGNYEYRLKEM